MSRSSLLSQIAGCSAIQALAKSQYPSQWSFIGAASTLARGLATVTSSSSSDSSSSAAVQKQEEYPPLYAACVLERLPVRDEGVDLNASSAEHTVLNSFAADP
jgi:hypothetical protein